MSEELMQCTPPELARIATNTLQDLIPQKPRKVYEFAYYRFVKWAKEHNASNYSENVLLAYFNHLSEKENLKSSTLWSQYSMLKATLNLHHNVQLANYTKLLAFLKRKNSGYKPKKSRTLTKEQVDEFLQNTPDVKYLAMKVILLLGVSGACRCDEITNLTMDNIEDLGSLIFVKISDTKTYKSRSFTILGEFYLNICRQYIALRKDIDINRFLVKYHNGKCQKMVMGKHKIASIPQEIASFLKLPNPNAYTGHCLRRTSATLLVDNGDISALKRHGGWRSTTVAEGYIENSIQNKRQTAMKILAPSDYNEPNTSNNSDFLADITNITNINNISSRIITESNCETNRLNNEAEMGINGVLKFENCKLERKLYVHNYYIKIK